MKVWIGSGGSTIFVYIIKDIKGVFIGGPGATKEYFFEKDYLRNEIKFKVADLFDIGYTDETGLRELVEKASDSIKDMQIAREKSLVNRFMTEVRKTENSLAVYGEAAIRSALEQKAVDLLLISEKLDKVKYTYKCPNCGSIQEIVKRPEEGVFCKNCDTAMNVENEEDLVEVLYHLADASGTKVEIISGDREDGQPTADFHGWY